MLVKNAENQNLIEFVNLKEMVPQEHLLRKIDAAIDFARIYKFVEGLCGICISAGVEGSGERTEKAGSGLIARTDFFYSLTFLSRKSIKCQAELLRLTFFNFCHIIMN